MAKKTTKPRQPNTVPMAAYNVVVKALKQAKLDRMALEDAIEEKDKLLKVADNNLAAAMDNVGNLTESNNKLVSMLETLLPKVN